MKRNLVGLAVCALVGAAGRHLLLSEGAAPGVVRFYSSAIELAEGARQSWVTITRTGDFTDPRYGKFSITLAQLAQMVSNFDARALGQDVFLDVAHKPNDGAAGRFVKLAVEGTKLRGLVEWTDFGLSAVKDRGFAYLSAEYSENFVDNEKQLAHGCVLMGAGLTTRPVIKQLDPVQLSEPDTDHGAAVRVAISPQLLRELTNMNYLEQLRAKLLAMGLAESAIVVLLAEAKKQFDDAGTDSVKALAVMATWEATGQAVANQIKTLGAAGTDPKQVVIQLATPAAPAVDVAGAVAKALADRDTAQREAAATLASRLTLLSTTIAAGDTTLTADGVKALAEEMAPMVTAGSTDDQVKALAAMQVRRAQEMSASRKLTSLGYNAPSGSVHIQVIGDSDVNSLQGTIDRRLGYDGMADAERYAKTGGRLLDVNKNFVVKALAHFDAQNGPRLVQEHKMLAAGTGNIADVKVPVIAERTVLREALYNLQSLSLVQANTAPFANVITLPYSYRDTTAAGMSALRRYEGQGIRNAGVIQTQEEARPLPQKLAMRITAEMQLLMSNSVIDYDPVAENVRNIIRIVGEDTEAINMNEMVISSDEAGVATITDTLTSDVNGTKAVFVTTKFPVVKPRKVYDLQGAQVGNTANPITVTLNSVARNEFTVNADGTALSAGTYWTMDYNLGELRFVNESGTPVVPTNAWPLTVAYSYTINAVKFDTDAVANEAVADRYDRLLTMIGGRKAVIGSDRYYNPNMLLMSATVDNALSQARSFTANSSRVATGLAADGSVGTVKALPAYNITAPGLMMGDTRILVGERGNTRFRMVKPFAMNQLEQARNATGQFIDVLEGFGTQYVISQTPIPLKNSLTSVVLYSGTGRVAR